MGAHDNIRWFVHPDEKDQFNFDIVTSKEGASPTSSATEAAAAAADHHEKELLRLREIGAKTPILPSQIGTDLSFKRQIVWSNLIGFVVLHLFALYGTVLTFQNVPSYKTTLYSVFLMYASGLGVTMGAHRLWSHRSYKAKLPLRVFLLWLHTLAGQNCLYVWVRDHRQHHKYSDTDADPHNANRGFFFSHIGWLMSRKHPKVIEYGRKIDMSDLEADRLIMFQKNHYKTMYMIFSLLLPTSVPVFFWNEDPIVALFTCFFARSVVQLNATWLVNSAAHLYGTRPYDKNIKPVESMFVAFFSVGEGWHNYHHAFPWDYRASELGTPLNMTGFLIDILATLGLVYGRKEATHHMVKSRANKCGDESHHTYGTPFGRKAVETLFNIWNHPANPTYNSLFRPRANVHYSGHSHSHHDDTAAAAASPSSLRVVDPSLLPIIVAAESPPSTPLNDFMQKLKVFMELEDSLSDDAECNNNRSSGAKNKGDLNRNADDALAMKM